MKFRKKPVVIEAEQWHPDGKPVIDVVGYNRSAKVERHYSTKTAHETFFDVEPDHAFIDTLEGPHIVSPLAALADIRW